MAGRFTFEEDGNAAGKFASFGFPSAAGFDEGHELTFIVLCAARDDHL